MTTKRIVFRRSDGVVEVVNPSTRRMAELVEDEGKTEDEALAVIQANAESHMADRGFGPMEDAEVMEATQIPYHPKENRMFRNALEKPGLGPPIVSMPKARVIKTDIIRADRDERLSLEDMAYMRADEQNNAAEKQRIATKKQALRDLPATIQPNLAAITTPEELETYQPTWPT